MGHFYALERRLPSAPARARPQPRPQISYTATRPLASGQTLSVGCGSASPGAARAAPHGRRRRLACPVLDLRITQSTRPMCVCVCACMRASYTATTRSETKRLSSHVTSRGMARCDMEWRGCGGAAWRSLARFGAWDGVAWHELSASSSACPRTSLAPGNGTSRERRCAAPPEGPLSPAGSAPSRRRWGPGCLRRARSCCARP